jgi:Flp pilus assembly protein TadB
MVIWISLVLAALICGYGIYKLFRGAPRESGDVSQASDDGAPAVVSSVTADLSDDELPKQLVPRVVDAPMDGPIPGAAQPKQGGLFSDFDGILGSDAGSALKRPRPEELPMSEDDMVFGSVTPALAEMLPESESRREVQRQNLAAAGLHSRAAWINLNAVRFVLAFLTLVIGGFWLLMAPPQLETYLLSFVVLGPLMMWALPPLLVSSKANERRIDIERGLPDVLDMLNMAVSQGLTVAASLRRISSEIASIHPALAMELCIVNQQARVGSLNYALLGFSQRIDSPEVTSFIALLIQSETTGTGISQALGDYSDSMRNSLRERADSRANAASFKLLFPTTLCLMPSVFLFLLGPAIVDMNDFFENTAGTVTQGRDDAVQSLDRQPVVVPAGN